MNQRRSDVCFRFPTSDILTDVSAAVWMSRACVAEKGISRTERLRRTFGGVLKVMRSLNIKGSMHASLKILFFALTFKYCCDVDVRKWQLKVLNTAYKEPAIVKFQWTWHNYSPCEYELAEKCLRGHVYKCECCDISLLMTNANVKCSTIADTIILKHWSVII